MAQKQLSIEPFAFVIGGAAACAVGYVADEYHESANDDNQFSDENIRSLRPVPRYIVRFLAGGLIYTLTDTLFPTVAQRRVPAVAAALTALPFAHTARKSVFTGSVLGSAIFGHLANMIASSR